MTLRRNKKTSLPLDPAVEMQKRFRHLRKVGRGARRVVRSFFRLHFILSFIFTIFIVGSVFVIITYVTYANDIASKEKIMNRNNLGIIVYDKDNNVIFREGQAHDFKITPLKQIAKPMVDATLAAEDANFYYHKGVSVTALAASFLADFKYHDPFKYGGSTITQQLVKNALVGHDKSYQRKLREIVLAVEIERRYTKDEILEMYLNSIYYGAGAYGVTEASQIYFNEEPSKLTLSQASFLAGLPNAPSYLTPFGGDVKAAYERQQWILHQMRDKGFLNNDKDVNQAIADQLVFAPYHPLNEISAPHFSLWVRNQVFNQFSEETAERLGYRIHTTLDAKIQQAAEDAVKKRVEELAKQKVSNGALVAIDPKTGGVMGMVGSVDYSNDAIGGKFNIAIDGNGRQPGSSFKPFVYAAAFDRGILTPASILKDQPTDFGDFGGEHFKPKNYDGKFHGDVTVRKALANSYNIPAVLALKLVGVDNAIDTAQNMGITTLKDRSRYGLSLVLGGGEVHLLEMVQAYSVFASNGVLHPYYAIEKIDDKFGNTVFDHKQDTNIKGSQVMDPRVAYLITNILSDNNARSEVFGTNSPLHLSRPAAAKTGTTDDYKDSWTMGYTPNLVAGAWIGNNDGTPMLGVAGAIGAAYVWNNFMNQVLPALPKEDFTEPPGIKHSKTCQKVQTKETRYLEDGTPYDHFEDRTFVTDDVFIEGTEPKDKSCGDNPGGTGNPDNSAQPAPGQPQTNVIKTPDPQTAALPAGYIIDQKPGRKIINQGNRVVVVDNPN